MKKQEQEAQKKYLEKLARARTTRNLINPDETILQKQERIRMAKADYDYMVCTYFKHITSKVDENGNSVQVPCAPFQLEHANRVRNNPLYKGYAQWFRGAAKSVHNDIFIPIWLWMNGVSRFFCIASDTFDRACDLLEDLRAEFEGNELLIHDFGEQKNPGYWERGNFVTTSGFIAKAFGARMKTRGLRKGATRPDLWVIDDLESQLTIKNTRIQDDYAEWIENDVIPTMTGPNRRLIGANNRFASRMVQTILKERHPDWDWSLIKGYDPVTYQPTWPEMYTAEYYRQQEKDMGILATHAEYNHEPLVKGKIFKPEMILYGPLPDLHTMNAIVAHWDVAYAGSKTSDFNAVKIWGRYRNDFWLIDGFVKQSKMKLAVEWMCMKELEFKAQGIQCFWQFESQFWNDELERIILETQAELGVTLNIVQVERSTMSKLIRLFTMHPYYQNGRIHVNELLKANPDIQTGLKQLYAIEPGMTEHDDSPDADEQAIKKLELYTATPASPNEPSAKSYRVGRVRHKYRY